MSEDPVAMNNATAVPDALEIAEEEHTYDAVTTLFLNITIIGCLMVSYAVRKLKLYYLPESAMALLIGVVLGGMARLLTDNLQLLEFSPEVFFFVFLPPIIFEAGYSLNRKDFFDNIGAIFLYAMVGTMISTFTVGILSNILARTGMVAISTNIMENLLFGSLISAVDPVATLSIMGNAELRCDRLLYSLVFGESVLNDAIAISLFRVFAKFYKEDGPNWEDANIGQVLFSFAVITVLSIICGVVLGLIASAVYRHTTLSDYPNLETSLLFSFCYLCYATGEAFGLSGIMALFFQGVVLSHYNSYNLSRTAHVASEQIFSTLATLAETAVFLYMGIEVFTGRFRHWDFTFSVMALAFCFVGRFLNIFPLSYLANCSRTSHDEEESTGSRIISVQMQCVLWFAGLRGAIAFALAMNMPGPNREVYATATLFICIFTTVVCGSMTDRILEHFGMKQTMRDESMRRLTYAPRMSPSRRGGRPSLAEQTSIRVYKGAKKLWKQVDDEVLRPTFGGSDTQTYAVHSHNGNDEDRLGNYELSQINDDDDSGSFDDEMPGQFTNGKNGHH